MTTTRMRTSMSVTPRAEPGETLVILRLGPFAVTMSPAEATRVAGELLGVAESFTLTRHDPDHFDFPGGT